MAVIYIQEHYLDKINLVYRNQENRDSINHKFLNDGTREFLKKNQLDKFDDIADTILMLLATR